ncbi:hypothetical protein [Streptomyces sp. H34-S4]|uniref:hypothetical protein n=1 Tax=Streptomyces sp. H34-S4 TaxID=2996463 RepID=UPI002271DF26|nr:hypothetical protein [Streptomyces sp. H34-S4]MCY0938742.1 hypothetical protein [Streptomyces sp. H34-S4]
MRDTILRPAEAELYEPLWSPDILEAARYRREPRDPHGLPDRLSAAGAVQFAAEMRRRVS